MTEERQTALKQSLQIVRDAIWDSPTPPDAQEAAAMSRLAHAVNVHDDLVSAIRDVVQSLKGTDVPVDAVVARLEDALLSALDKESGE